LAQALWLLQVRVAVFLHALWLLQVHGCNHINGFHDDWQTERESSSRSTWPCSM